MEFKLWIFAVLNSLGHFHLGYSFIYLSSCLYQSLGLMNIKEDQWEGTIGQMMSMVSFGGMFGCLLIQLLRRYYTKRDIFNLMDMMNLLATLLLFYDNLKLFLIGRFLQGIYTGASSVLTLKLLTEYCKGSDIHAVMNIAFLELQIAFSFGVFLSIFMPTKYDPENVFYIVIYAIPFFTSAARLLCNVLVYRFETPVDHLAKDQRLLAIEAIKTVYDNKADVEQVLQEKDEQVKREQQVSVKSIVSKDLFLSIYMLMIQQFAGVNAISMYSQQIFYKVIPDVMISRYVSIGFISIGAIASLFSPTILKKLGLKQTMVQGGYVLTFILIVMSLSSHMDQMLSSDSSLNKLNQITSLVSTMMYNFVYSSTVGPVPWIFSGQKLSDSQMSIMSLANFLATGIFSYLFPQMLSRLGISSSFAFFAASCFGGMVTLNKFWTDEPEKIKQKFKSP